MVDSSVSSKVIWIDNGQSNTSSLIQETLRIIAQIWEKSERKSGVVSCNGHMYIKKPSQRTTKQTSTQNKPNINVPCKVHPGWRTRATDTTNVDQESAMVGASKHPTEKKEESEECHVGVRCTQHKKHGGNAKVELSYQVMTRVDG